MLDENGELQVASELEQLPQDYINMLTFGLEYKFLLDKINSLQQTVT